jgi:MoaA/NifB/PqqE/SkfB family radical SAM enzyme
MSTPHELPLVTLYLTDRCNSRCVTCDYWRHGRSNVTFESVERLMPDLARLGTRVALLSGGEPLLHAEWQKIAALLRDGGIRPWLLTSGLSLLKHAARATDLCESITVSLDGTCAETYQAIRGLDAFDNVCAGIRAAAELGKPAALRVTLQRRNYRELLKFVRLAHELGAQRISFLAVDVSNPHAFGRETAFSEPLALDVSDLAQFDTLLDAMENEFAADFASGFIAESPAKLRRIRHYFAGLHGLGPFPPVRCNAPEFSAVVGVDGQLSPCFFIPGPPDANVTSVGLRAALEGTAMSALRADIRAGSRRECARCVCSMWRDPGQSFA